MKTLKLQSRRSIPLAFLVSQKSVEIWVYCFPKRAYVGMITKLSTHLSAFWAGLPERSRSTLSMSMPVRFPRLPGLGSSAGQTNSSMYSVNMDCVPIGSVCVAFWKKGIRMAPPPNKSWDLWEFSREHFTHAHKLRSATNNRHPDGIPCGNGSRAQNHISTPARHCRKACVRVMCLANPPPSINTPGLP